MAHWTKTLHINFQVNWTNACVVLAVFCFLINLIVPPSVSAAHFFVLTKDWDHTYVNRVWWRYLIPFRSHFSKRGPTSYWRLASLYDSESKLHIFLIIIDIHCSENISALVWLRSVEKPKTGSQMQVLENVLMSDKLYQKWNRICFDWAKDSNDIRHLSLWQTVYELRAVSRL